VSDNGEQLHDGYKNDMKPRLDYPVVKRVVDCCAAAIALILILPVMALISIIIYWKMGRPIFFRQVRPGLNGKLFTCLKYRTMREPRRVNGQIEGDTERLTPLGLFLRRTSLDELPQLWSILRGDMSLIGPRPLLPEYLEYYTPEEARRHLTRPGLTGWAQIHGRNYLSFQKRLEMDTWYVDNMCWTLDARILLATVRVVLSGKDVASDPDQCGTLVSERKAQVQTS